MRNRTKLRLTWASFIVHCMIILGWLIAEMFEPILWASWFASFNTTIGIYATAKTYKDKVIINTKEKIHGRNTINSTK